MSLELLPRVRSGVFCVFLSLRGAEQLFFCGVFHPNSRVGNSRLHSTRFNYLGFYGIWEALVRQSLQRRVVGSGGSGGKKYGKLHFCTAFATLLLWHSGGDNE